MTPLHEDMHLAEPAVRRVLDTEAVECRTPVVLYLCPTEGCVSHFASPRFRPDRDAVEAMQHRRSQDGNVVEAHTRVECPDCRQLGLKVDRVAYVVASVVPLAAVIAELKAAEKAAAKAAKAAAASEAKA